MEWSMIEREWATYQWQIRARWGRLSDDDLRAAGGRRDQLVSVIQQRYGVAFETAQREVDGWARALERAGGARN